MYPTLARVHALAIAIMVDLACRSGGGPVPSEELRRRFRLSKSYFDKIAAELRRQRLMRSTRQPGGGNELGRAASLISMRDIVEAMQSPLAGAAQPRKFRGATGGAVPMSTDLWAAVESRQLEWLGSVTLDSMVMDCLRSDRGNGLDQAASDLGNDDALAFAATQFRAQIKAAARPRWRVVE